MTFRFDPVQHEYIDLDTGLCYPHITGMLQATGWVDDRWFTEESSDRGVNVHSLTAAYDLKALHVESCQSIWRGYLLGYVKAMSIVRPQIHAVEEPRVHGLFKFGGRPDRDITAYGMRGTLEIKSGQKAPGHQIQTALQTILLAEGTSIPPHAMLRLCVYVKDNGKFKVERHEDRGDYAEAARIIRQCCH